MRGRVFLVALVAFLMVGGLVVGGNRSLVTTPVRAAICNDTVPLGAIAPARPEWCAYTGVAGIDTHQEGANAWEDSFNHGQTHAALSTAYARGKANGDGCDLIHFQHNNHWMVDIQGNNGQWPTLCAAWMRPNRTFSLAPGATLVIEFEVASPIAGTRNCCGIGDAWPEFTISADPLPERLRQNGTYLYETMAGFWTFGCRMQQSKHPICALYQPADGPPAQPYRRWEINQNGGDVASETNGGVQVGTGSAIDLAWKGCTSIQDPDTVCRNTHRVELTRDGIRFFINGVPGYSAVFINDDMDNLFAAPFYVYFGDFAYQIEQDVVIRFHWDRLAINPQGVSPSPSPTSSPSPSPAPSPTSTPSPTPSPTATPTASPSPSPSPTASPSPTPTATPSPTSSLTVTFDDKTGQNQPLDGSYAGIGWGTGQWFHSGPWGGFTTKSASFTSGRTSSTFTFLTARRLRSLQAYNGGSGPSTVTLSCQGQATVSVSVPVGQVVTIQTGWTAPCASVLVTSSNGWDTNFDNLIHDGG